LGCAGCEKGVCRKDVKSHVNDKLLNHVMMQNSRIKSLEQSLAQVIAELEKVKGDKECLEQGMKANVSKLEAKDDELEYKVKEIHQMVVISKPQSGQHFLEQLS
jgi:predicted  nucleic acid-binding Zn-ribbon protein